MTARKRFKRLVRARAANTGESYTAALRHFRVHALKEYPVPARNRFDEALWQLGVRHDTLSNAERSSLARDGYVVIDSVLSARDLDTMQARADALLKGTTQGVLCGHTAADDEAFAGATLHPRLLAAAAHVLGTPFFFSPGVALRDPLPGSGEQSLHQDVGPWPPHDLHPYRIIAQWHLDAATERNGAVRVVPGSHLVHPRDFQEWAYTDGAHHRDEVVLIAPAGSLIVRHATLWHSATRNDSSSRRRSAHVMVSTWDDTVGRDLRVGYQEPVDPVSAQHLLSM